MTIEKTIIESSNSYWLSDQAQRRLTNAGFVYNESLNKWFLTSGSPSKIRQGQKLCRKFGLKYFTYPESCQRSGDYRAIFLRTHPSIRGMYRCAYCFKKIPAKSMEVDHIIPVYRAKTRRSTRFLMKQLNLESINDPRNLAAACHSCNRKKGTKGGLWVVRGYLSKHTWFRVLWVTIKVVGVLLLFVILIVGILCLVHMIGGEVL